MKMTVLAGALLIGALAACGGGSSGGSLTPTATATAAVPTPVPQGATTYANVVAPANGYLTDTGEAFTLASAVPVYNIGPNLVVNFSTTGPITLDTTPPTVVPQAVQVGTTDSAVDIDLSDGTVIHWAYVNGNTSVPCIFQSTGNVPNGNDNITGFACAGNPF